MVETNADVVNAMDGEIPETARKFANHATEWENVEKVNIFTFSTGTEISVACVDDCPSPLIDRAHSIGLELESIDAEMSDHDVDVSWELPEEQTDD